MKRQTVNRILVVVSMALASVLVIASPRCEPREGSVPDVPPRNETAATDPPGPPRNAAFDVRVEIPRIHRPAFGLLEAAGILLKEDPEFGDTSPGASAGWVKPRRLQLRAEGWDLVIVTGNQGEIAPGTHLIYPMEPEGPTIRCHPAVPPAGHLRLTTPPDARELDGEFIVKLASCESAASGKPIEWPLRPLTIVGSFANVPRR